MASKEDTAVAMTSATFSILRIILTSPLLSKTVRETNPKAISPKGGNSGPAYSVGADAPRGAPLQGELGRSVKRHVSLP